MDIHHRDASYKISLFWDVELNGYALDLTAGITSALYSKTLLIHHLLVCHSLIQIVEQNKPTFTIPSTPRDITPLANLHTDLSHYDNSNWAPPAEANPHHHKTTGTVVKHYMQSFVQV